MARVLDVVPGRRLHGNTKYPWSLWLDGRVWELHRGVDYDCEHNSFRVRASDEAWKARGSLRWRPVRNDAGEQVGWVIQILPLDDISSRDDSAPSAAA